MTDIKGVIFDLDGTIIDSMWVWDKIDFDFLNKRNISVPNNLKGEIEHFGFDETAHYFKRTFNLEESVDDIKKEWMDMAFKEYSESIKLKPGIKTFLDILKKTNIKIGLATSNCHYLLESVLKNNDIYHYFDAITITDEVLRGKSFPDVYLLSCSKLGLTPNQCVVFEDILPAIKGAKSAGMKVVAIQDQYCDYSKDDLLKYADEYISDYIHYSLTM